MYYRSQGYRYPRDVRIPINYSGSTFSNSESNNEGSENTENAELSVSLESSQGDTDTITDYSESDTALLTDNEEIEATPSAPTSVFKGLGSNSLFGGRIGSEELLILALVFLLSDTDADSDIIWLLLLLLFIK